MSWHANPWTTAQLAIVVLGAVGFGWLGADDFGPKDFFGHLANGAAVYAAMRKGGA